MLAAYYGVAAAAHSVGSSVLEVATSEPSASASRIAPRGTGTWGTASTMASVASSSAGVGRTR
jgi:hypothetical protein